MFKISALYTENPKCSGTVEYLGKYTFLKKCFSDKVVVRYKAMYLMMLEI